MTRIAIIPARGGSKRIPRKNIKDFCGKPIIAYSIQAALDSNLFDTVMVSTEDKEIAEIARKYGAEVPFLRSSKNADDNTGILDVLLEVIDSYSAKGQVYDEVCCVLATAPLITSNTLSSSNSILDEKSNAVIATVKFNYPIQRSFNMKDSFLKMNWPENYNMRSQDLEDMYHDAGQFYWIKSDVLIKEKQIFTKRAVGYVISELLVQDIDTPEDWKIAEMKYKLMISNV